MSNVESTQLTGNTGVQTKIVGIIDNGISATTNIDDNSEVINVGVRTNKVSITAPIASGARGKSAYQTWLEQGNVGSEEDFINYLRVSGINYIHDQMTASKEWVIPHNLGKFPSVTIVDTGGNVVMGDIHYKNVNEIIISFTFEFSGKAYLN